MDIILDLRVRKAPIKSEKVFPCIRTVFSLLWRRHNYVPTFHDILFRLSEERSLDSPTSSDLLPCLRLKGILLLSVLGWVQTPGWDGDREYQALMDSCVTLTVPPNHVIMTSFVDIDLDRCDSQGQGQGQGRACPCDVIELYLSPSCTGTPESSFCQLSDRPLPRVLHTPGALSIRFLADYNDQRTGFRFLYSFHPSSEHPMQLAGPGPGLGPGPGPGPDGALWNCSGSDAAVHVLKQHFICSPDQFCAGMEEDKLSGRCSLGDLCGAMNVFHFDDVCYVYGDLRVQSWEQAEDTCQNHGGHLASLNSPRKWRQLLSWRKSFSGKFLDYVFVGLRLAEPSLPDM